jgi:TetR/AcrR family transcriptional repressor of nem operon
MPRKAQYDVTRILQQAIDIFLNFSYHGAKMEDIIAQTEFNRRGFYIEFGSKQTFLYQVLEFYYDHQLLPVIAELESHQGLLSIQQFFTQYIELISGRGCLLINCVTELGQGDPHIRSQGRHYLDRLQQGFIGCLEQAQRQGVIHAHINIESTALQLTSYVQGFAVNAILADSKQELKLATQALLDPIVK